MVSVVKVQRAKNIETRLFHYALWKEGVGEISKKYLTLCCAKKIDDEHLHPYTTFPYREATNGNVCHSESAAQYQIDAGAVEQIKDLAVTGGIGTGIGIMNIECVYGGTISYGQFVKVMSERGHTQGLEFLFDNKRDDIRLKPIDKSFWEGINIDLDWS